MNKLDIHGLLTEINNIDNELKRLQQSSKQFKTRRKNCIDRIIQYLTSTGELYTDEGLVSFTVGSNKYTVKEVSKLKRQKDIKEKIVGVLQSSFENTSDCADNILQNIRGVDEKITFDIKITKI